MAASSWEACEDRRPCAAASPHDRVATSRQSRRLGGRLSERARGRAAPTRVLLVACFGAFLAFLDATIVNVAFPSIRESFPGRVDRRPVVGAERLQHRVRRVPRRVRAADRPARPQARVAGGIVLFTLASALWCAAAPNLDLLVAGRVLQALGAALLVPASLALVVEAFPDDRRAHAIGLWGATAAVAAGLGPPDGRRPGRARRLAVGLPGQPPLRRRSPWWPPAAQLVESRAPGRRILPDLLGAAAARRGPGAAEPRRDQGQRLGLGAARACVGSFAVAVLLGALFVLSSRRHRVAARSTPPCSGSRRSGRHARHDRWPASASSPTC